MPILCATNFSDEALSATTVAGELARLMGEELWLVFVLPENTAKAFGEAVLSTAEQTLQGEAARVRRLGATVKPALLKGKFHVELPKFAALNQVQLVIAGGSHKEPSLLGGGTLVRLAHHLELPLWVMRNPEPVVAWAKGQRPLKVLLAMDQTQTTQAAVGWLEGLGRHGKLEVVAGHIFWPPAEYVRLGLSLPRTWDQPSLEVIQALQRELKDRLPASLGERVRIEPGFGRAADHLNALAADEHVDLLVTGGHHHSGLGQLWSVSEQALQLAPVSVVRVPGTVKVAAAVPRVRRVLAATDFSPTGDRAIAEALAVLEPSGTLDLIHVAPGPLSEKAEKELIEKLQARIPPGARAQPVTIQAHALPGSDVPQAIVAAAERFSSQLICVGSRGDSGLARLALGSTARAVLGATHRPVLIIKPPEA